jgi:SOS-response transcriptional repressor LexA
MNSIGSTQLGLLLRVLRMRGRLEQEALAQRCAVSQSTVSRWESGVGRPSLAQARVWLEACANMQTQVQGSREKAQADPASGDARAAALAYLAELEKCEDKVQGSRGQVQAAGAPTADPLEPRTLNLEPFVARLRAALLALLRTAPEIYDTQVPYFADVAAGLGEAQEQRSAPRSLLGVPREVYARDPSCYALRVSGDSMAPQLLDGDIVIVSPAAELFDGCIVAAYVEPDGDVVKVLRQLPKGAILLQPLNPAYPAIVLAPDEEREARIWGRIVLAQREL